MKSQLKSRINPSDYVKAHFYLREVEKRPALSDKSFRSLCKGLGVDTDLLSLNKEDYPDEILALAKEMVEGKITLGL